MHEGMRRREFLASGAATISAAFAAPLNATPRKRLTLAAVGDCIITRRASNNRDRAFLELVQMLRRSDCTIGNCEMNFGDDSILESSAKGYDMNLIADPACADDLAWMGFDLMGYANNHAMDYGSRGMRSTLTHLHRVGIVATGAGTTLSQAEAPAYFDSPHGRVALVSCTSFFPEWSQAEEARKDGLGRAGINPLHLSFTTNIEGQSFDELKRINAEIATSEGEKPDPNYATAKSLQIGDKRIAPGPPGYSIEANADDVARIGQAIKIARGNADLVCVMVHDHEEHKAGDYFQKFAHSCIDAGADCFFAAGPHELNAIEIYKEKPICYSLGNFFFEFETVRQIPGDVLEAHGLDRNAAPTVLYDEMYRNYFGTSVSWTSVAVQLEFESGKLTRFQLNPISLGQGEASFARGVPRVARGKDGTSILEHLQTLSSPYGTRIDIQHGSGSIRL
jgi:poly-gamma-glutamate synthesis protein (capsule biosynthesis protein)